ASGSCSSPAKLDGAPCDDGSACTQTDACEAGICVGANPVMCTAADQCHAVGVCNPASGVCSSPAKLDGAPCDDGSACTQTDACEAGIWVGAEPVVCTAADQCHAVGVCNPASGVCSSPAKLDGAPCDDGSACTQTDACEAGICVGANPVVCTAADQCHTVGACNPASGICSSPAKLDGAPCDDGSACTQTDAYDASMWGRANPVTCTAADQCHAVGACNPASGLCSSPAKLDGAPCDDGSACTQTDACEAGICVGANPVVCTAADQCHTAGACNPASGLCSNPAKLDGAPCDDGSACTQTDA